MVVIFIFYWYCVRKGGVWYVLVRTLWKSLNTKHPPGERFVTKARQWVGVRLCALQLLGRRLSKLQPFVSLSVLRDGKFWFCGRQIYKNHYFVKILGEKNIIHDRTASSRQRQQWSPGVYEIRTVYCSVCKLEGGNDCATKASILKHWRDGHDTSFVCQWLASQGISAESAISRACTSSFHSLC